MIIPNEKGEVVRLDMLVDLWHTRQGSGISLGCGGASHDNCIIARINLLT